MAKIAQLVEGNYNILDNIPVINQDLTASGFTPVANTYYRHTGATTDTFTQGIIYLYDTAYHKLGESGGTTLNRYEYNVNLSSPTLVSRARIRHIAEKAIKYSMHASCSIKMTDGYSVVVDGDLAFDEYSYIYSGILCSGDLISSVALTNAGDSITKAGFPFRNNAISKIDTMTSINLKIIYYNNTEITK